MDLACFLYILIQETVSTSGKTSTRWAQIESQSNPGPPVVWNTSRWRSRPKNPRPLCLLWFSQALSVSMPPLGNGDCSCSLFLYLAVPDLGLGSARGLDLQGAMCFKKVLKGFLTFSQERFSFWNDLFITTAKKLLHRVAECRCFVFCVCFSPQLVMSR